MKIKRPEIILSGIQLKSLEKIKRLAQLLDEIEVEVGIYETRITIADPFICPEINLNELSSIGMEGSLKLILNKILTKRKEQ